MKARIRFKWIGVLGVVSFTLFSGLFAGESVSRPIQADSDLEAVIPPELKSMLLREPYVQFLITVDANGTLVDHLATYATHYGLLDRAEKRLLRAKFSPAIAEGVPVQSSAEVSVTFFDPEQRAFHSGLISVPYGSSSMDAAVRWMSEAGKDALKYHLSQPDELDSPLQITNAKVLVMTDAEGRPAKGDCMVEFYVNDRGEVRLPRIVRSDNDTVSMSALLTVRETRFAPLTRKGLPTYVKVRQPMEFNPGEKTSKSG